MNTILIRNQIATIFIVFGLAFAWLGFGSDSALSKIEQREKKLKEREEALQEQILRHEKTIQGLRSSFEKEKAENEQKAQSHEASWKKKLNDLERELKERTAQLEVLQGRQLAAFLGIYEKMEPKQAAKVLEGTDLKMATQIITQMKPQKAAEILAKMNPEKARIITESGFLQNKKTISQKVNEVTENNPIAPIGDTEKN